MALLFVVLPLVAQPEPPDAAPEEDVPALEPARPAPLVRSSAPPSRISEAPVTRPERLRMLNGDSFSGTLLGLENGRIQWRHPSAEPVIPFKASDVADLEISQRPRPQGARAHNSSVRLVNGDLLLGDLKELTPQQLVLDTWYAGLLKLPRQSVVELHPVLTGSRVVFAMREGDASGWLFGNFNNGIKPKPLAAVPAGPVGEGGERARAVAREVLGEQAAATSGNKLWRYDGSGFVSTTSGAVVCRQDIACPDRFELGFDLQWTGSTSCYFNLCFLASSIKDAFSGDHYRLQVSSGYFYLYRRTKQGNQSQLGRVQLREKMNNKTRMRVEFLVNRPKGELTLVVDGVKIETFMDGNKTPMPNSRGLSFQSTNAQAIRISKIRVSDWNGKMPGEKVESNGREDFIFFTNKDHIQGEVKGIKEGRVTVMSASLGKLPPVDLSKVARMRFANPTKKAEPVAGETRATLAGGGRLTGRFESWAPGKVRWVHPFAGLLELHPAVFHSLEMNRDQPRPRKKEGIFSQ